MSYTKVGKNIYFYLNSNGKRTYRARKFHLGVRVSRTFKTLKAAKEWLKTTLTTTEMGMKRVPIALKAKRSLTAVMKRSHKTV